MFGVKLSRSWNFSPLIIIKAPEVPPFSSSGSDIHSIFRCREFNVLGMTHFGSLAAHAIKVWEWNRWAAKLNFTKISPAEVNCDQLQPKVSCDKFSLAYNWFGRLHDSSFEVDYHLNHHHHHHLWGCHFQLPGRVWFVRHPREHVQQFGRKAFLGFATSSPWAGCSLSTLL